MMRYLLLLLLTGFGFTGFAQHTFSIVAVDTATGQVGAAGATCLDSSGVIPKGARIISDLIPGVGAINSQASVCIPNSNLINGIAWLAQGHTASAIIDSLTFNDNCGFGDSANRQYGVALIDSLGNPRAASFTGSGALAWAGHANGVNYSAQGNILLGSQIVDSIEAGFVNTTGPLCDKLMAALQGANVPGADSRCFAHDSVSSLSAFIRVANPTDTSGSFYMDLYTHSLEDGYDPIDALQLVFDIFKTGDCSGVSSSFTSTMDTVEVFGSITFNDNSTDVLSRVWDMSDGGMFTDNRTSFNYGFSTTGDKEVKLIGTTYTCVDTFTKVIHVTWPVGIEEKVATGQLGLKLAPNPATDRVEVLVYGSDSITDVVAIDMLGRTIQLPYWVSDGQLLVDTRMLESAQYILQVTDKSGRAGRTTLIILP